MNPKYLAGGAVILAALGYLLFGGLGKNLVYFVTPTEFFADQSKYANKQVRLGGLVKAKTVKYNPKTLELTFTLTDGAKDIEVKSDGSTPPALFSENKGVVVEGTLQNKVFVANSLLVKHSEEYSIPKEGTDPATIRSMIEATQ